MSPPLLTPAAARAHSTFLALLWALSNPGRIERLPDSIDNRCAAVGEALIDLETTFYSPDEALASRLARTGARPTPPRQARYQFYPVLRTADLPAVEAALTGTFSYPDDSATIVAGCRVVDALDRKIDRATRLCLSGPGIAGTSELVIADVPTELWAIRERTIRYPLGWDLFLVSPNGIAGLPRTTIVEIRS